MKIKYSEMVTGYAFLIPLFIVLGTLIAYPFFKAISLSFTDKMIGMPARFVGFQNYITLIRSSIFHRVARNSLIYTSASIPAKFLLGMGMALLLNQPIKGRNIFRGMLLLPWIVPTIASVCIWFWMYNDFAGIFNIALQELGISQRGVAWLASPGLAMFSVVAVNVWRDFPFFGVNLLAGFQTVPRELLDAAKVDGCSSWKSFWFVTIPYTRHVIIITLLVMIIWTFKDFTIVFMLTGGGPGVSTQIFATYTYELAINLMRLGEGIAVSLFIFPLLIALIIVYLRLTREVY